MHELTPADWQAIVSSLKCVRGSFTEMVRRNQERVADMAEDAPYREIVTKQILAWEQEVSRIDRILDIIRTEGYIIQEVRK